MWVAWGGYLSDEDNMTQQLYIICTKALVIYITVTADYKFLSLLEQSLLSSVSLLSYSPSPPLSPSGFMCIIMLSVTCGTTLSFSKYPFWIFSACFQYPC